MSTLWVVTPVYYDVECFLPLRDDLLTTLEGIAEPSFDRVRFVAIDDSGGLDPGFDRLVGLADVKVVRPPFNLGHQGALVLGLRAIAKGIDSADTVVTMDSDGQDRPQDLPRLLASLGSNLGAVAVARRTHRTETLAFKALYLAFRLLFRFLTGTVVRSGNFAAYRGWFPRRALAHPYFDLCYSSTLLVVSPEIHFVPCARGSRYSGQGHMGPARLAIHGVRMMMPFIDRIAIRALAAFSLTFAVAAALVVAVVGVKLLTDAAVPGWATSTLLGAIGISLIALGNFVVLFAVFAQSRAVSFADVKEVASERP